MAEEREYVWIAQLNNTAHLTRADRKDFIEQWELKTVSNAERKGGVIRVRSYDGKRFVLTAKKYESNAGQEMLADEEETPCTEAMFNIVRSLAPVGCIKTRYYFDIPGTPYFWEYDVFQDEHGFPLRWCKVDLEIKKDNPIKPPPFPCPMDKVISGKMAERTVQENHFVRQLFEDKFLIYKPDNILPLNAHNFG